MTVKALDTGAVGSNGEFEAILSTSALDRQGEQVMPGAFDPLPASVPIFSNHSWMRGANPIGEGTPRYDRDVLKIKGHWAPTPEAQETRVLVAGGFIKAMSAGFLTKLRDARDSRKIVKAELIEASTASIPVNPEALFAMAKSLGGSLAPLDVDHRLVVRPKAAASNAVVDQEFEACRREVTKALTELVSDDLLESYRRDLDKSLVDAGVDVADTAAYQALWLRAYGRVLRRQIDAA